MAATEAASEPGAGWDEAQCKAALAHLEQLQAQVDDLRLAIPRIIEPFHLPANPVTFKLYAQGVLSSQNGVKQLHEAWKNPETQSIFEHTRKSQAGDSDMSAGASIPDYDWIEREKRERVSQRGGQSEITEKSLALTHEDITRAVLELQKTHPQINIKVTTQDGDDVITTHFVSGAVKLSFRVSIERDANEKHKLNAECLGATEPSLAITRCITSRPQANDLKYLLDMIAAYKTVKGTSCAKCTRMLDSAALLPTARRIKHSSGTNETPETIWEAFHESCL